ncbi:dipeptidyl peptidase 1-like [Acanthaster planci]|uniref:Dipeptidyl peptidase 1 n=1 Tax=Acanthaster planci TaxID=133434 RepID=A0A8B7XRK9_ACAPL|nr:dipeptidyl peptidase 1-like [Acanthaster planci]XP_022083480.1 dipeptidyl peptidase 1-like [Acanthaster planci]
MLWSYSNRRLLAFCTIVVWAHCGLASADTPANCSFDAISGKWMFYIGPGGHTNKINCSQPWHSVSQWSVMLHFPDVAVDKNGLTGFWTLIYNQGFEVVIHGRKFFGFSDYEVISRKHVISLCNITKGWVHNSDGRNWACFRGVRVSGPGVADPPASYTVENVDEKRLYKQNEDFIEKINQYQSSWNAKRYSMYDNLTMGDIQRRAGGRKWKNAYPPPTIPDEKTRAESANLPDHFDWRNVGGVSFVPPVRDQGICGSCYAFASTALQESRYRVLTNNSIRLVLSPQEIVSCSMYSQKCDGGFPYLIAGKYGQDFGLVDDSCFPYTEYNEPCRPVTCRRFKTSDYRYIGGFYGACNEDLMKIELLRNGPVAVSFEVYDDFLYYRGGIYKHTMLTDRYNPWQTTNHVVLVVGYGYAGDDPDTGEKYWIVQNTWGESWGMEGYFKIRRGTNECHIESMAVATLPRP